MTTNRAEYGAAAFRDISGNLPNPFPRTIGPNAMKYLQEVVDSGLTCDMMGRFEKSFAREMGVKHCIAAPGCTPALAALAHALHREPTAVMSLSTMSAANAGARVVAVQPIVFRALVGSPRSELTSVGLRYRSSNLT